MTIRLPDRMLELAGRAMEARAPIVWLTGAGISAESGVPTFRGAEGYWRVGSRNYQPEELATRASFMRMPGEVWSWYLYRRGVCRAAVPNAAHVALAELERTLGDRMLLITQNVDGLHLRAGSSLDRTYQIHGNIDFMRAFRGGPAVPIPDSIPIAWPKERRVTDDELARLTVDGEPARPHVLWFDETYDEERFRFESSIRAANETPLLIVVGTTGATNLPLQIGAICARRGAPIVVVNPDPNPFSELALAGGGAFLAGTAGQWVPALAGALASS